jgi:hypothetical protein
MNRLYNYIKHIIDEKKAQGIFYSFILRILTSRLTRIITCAVYTAIITYESANSLWLLFSITTFISIIFLVLAYSADAYKEYYYKLNIDYIEFSQQFSRLNQVIARETRVVIKAIKRKEIIDIDKSFFDQISFQSVCNLVCQTAYTLIEKLIKKKRPESLLIAIYAKYSESADGKEGISLIAYANAFNDPPHNTDEFIPLESKPSKDERENFQRKLFRKDCEDIAVLINMGEVGKNPLINR